MLGAFRAVFALLLTVILVGIGAGSLIAASLQRRVKDVGMLLIAIQSLFVASTLAGMWSADSSAIDRTVSDALRAFGSAVATDQLASPSALTELLVQPAPDAAPSRSACAVHRIRISARQCADPARGTVSRPPCRRALSREHGRGRWPAASSRGSYCCRALVCKRARRADACRRGGDSCRCISRFGSPAPDYRLPARPETGSL
jgi:hypothetical protein